MFQTKLSMRAVSLVGAFIYGLAMMPALADAVSPPAPPPQRRKGTIDSFDPASELLNVKVDASKVVTITLRQNARIIYNEKRSVADIKPGDFVGTAALKGADGKLHAQEVHIFPDALRGMGEGQFGMGDANPNRSMTNATVAEVASVEANSGTIKLSYHGASAEPDGSCSGHAPSSGIAGCTGEAEIQVARGVPVIAMMVGDASLLVPGAAVSVFVVTTPDGRLESPGLTVEKAGIKPIL
jgi:hypothetical protein